MAIDISNFRNVSTGLFELDREISHDAKAGAVAKGNSRLASRVRGWANSVVGNTSSPDPQKIQGRIEVKQAFLTALTRSEGTQNAQRALSKAGLPKDWASNSKPLTSRQISTLLSSAQHYRMGVVRQNESTLSTILPDEKDYFQRDLRSTIIKTVRDHEDYGRQVFTSKDIEGLRQKAYDQVRSTETEQARSRFPGLTHLMEQRQAHLPNEAQVRIRAHDLVNETRQLLSSEVQTATTGKAMRELEGTTVLLSKSAWNQEDLRALDKELSDHATDLNQTQGELSAQLHGLLSRGDALKTQLNELGVDPENPPSGLGEKPIGLMKQLNDVSERVSLTLALHEDMGRQLDLIDAKQTYLEAVRLNDPLSTRAVAHNNVVWAQAGLQLIADIREQVASGKLTLDAPANGNATDALAVITSSWKGLITEKEQAYTDSAAPQATSNVPLPSKKNKSSHPVIIGKQEIIAELRSVLAQAGFTSKQIDKLTNDKALRKAQLNALSVSPTWQTVERDMLIVRDGAVHSYKSKITPAQHLNERFKESYTVDGQVRGVTAGEADQPNHARNLKLSELFNSEGKRISAVVGHGVLDMWKIADPELRKKANAGAAKEVLELAVASNPRLCNTISKARAAGEPVKPLRVTHVSVNLISPDNLRSTPLFNALKSDYAEKDYTLAQFAAFEANSGQGQKLQVDGGEPVTVDVNAITFSFGINGIATDPKLSAVMMGVWPNVHAHNTANMVKLIGDLGEGEFGAVGTPPGGFIGEVYDLAKKAGNTEQLEKLRIQTDVVRQLFTSRAFMEGRGDTAKMGREILALQNLAEETLDILGIDDMAATMDKGCKSDKDRGGVTDAELKTKLIVQDLGGEVTSNARLVNDDQQALYTVSASSGQLENQRWNTGLGGSKEVGHLEERLPDLQVRAYLIGLGKFTSA